MHLELRAASAQPLSHKTWGQARGLLGQPQLGGFSSSSIPKQDQKMLAADLHPAHPHAAGGQGALSRIAAPRLCRGNPLRSPAAPGSRLWTLPSILHPGFRSLSAPNNAVPAKHLPQADRARQAGWPGRRAAGARFLPLSVLRHAGGQKAAVELARGVPALPATMRS